MITLMAICGFLLVAFEFPNLILEAIQEKSQHYKFKIRFEINTWLSSVGMLYWIVNDFFIQLKTVENISIHSVWQVLNNRPDGDVELGELWLIHMITYFSLSAILVFAVEKFTEPIVQKGDQNEN